MCMHNISIGATLICMNAMKSLQNNVIIHSHNHYCLVVQLVDHNFMYQNSRNINIFGEVGIELIRLTGHMECMSWAKHYTAGQ